MFIRSSISLGFGTDQLFFGRNPSYASVPHGRVHAVGVSEKCRALRSNVKASSNTRYFVGDYIL